MGVVIWQIEQKATNKEENRNPLLDVELQKLHWYYVNSYKI